MVASGLPVTELSTNTLFFLYVEQKAVRVFGRLDRFGETVLNVSLSLSLSLSLFKPPEDGRHGPASVQSVPPSAHTKVFEEDGGDASRAGRFGEGKNFLQKGSPPQT